ncbi:2-oxoglutarate dehydrogenase complex dihydrolipoyllysine-residue succinyltransferase [Teredinibacter waterburyi]|uniref:2-oxoglutarate dehydrogenase complex dihydrolipoyllysine-residue succinyltransferase n=1 Tax=Teredinibacter waterburyi TaxID=1500538 RepID=UPI00165F82D2|nr:2-oxoglutarate dehydrogenase complex dihydrolipoyllysine-residue succinyltransferase [Teredinibacter waterburyi]
MSNEIKVPTFPESVQEGTIATWHKQPGEAFSRDEVIVDIETDKVVQEVPAPADGVLQEIVKGEGETVVSNEVIAIFSAGSAGEAPAAASSESSTPAAKSSSAEIVAAPAAKKMASEKGIDLAAVSGTGKGGLITKEDVASYIKNGAAPAAPAAPAPATPVAPSTKSSAAPAQTPAAAPMRGERIEKRVPMTRLRARIAERLLEASQSTAMLTTFNEVNMAPIMELRAKYKEQFEKSHNGTRLGFMGFFVKAAVEALRRLPAVNTSLDGNDIVYHGYQDIGVAVSTEKGLVVPVLRNAENMSLADVESGIRDFGMRARDGKISIDEMMGGTFTITNGGVFGSLMSTPILNPPQAAILGMHKIQERPMAVNGEVKVLPMMYLALSYDHRLIDGKEAVQFLVAIKNMIEDPARILLEL